MVQKKVIRTIKEYHMLKKNDRVLVCVSGGADSTALLLLLHSLKDKFMINIHIAHLNHMLRGKESDKDEEFVRRLAETLKLPLTVEHKRVALSARREKLSLEDAARCARYEFFLKTARELNAQKIAVGHTLDDEAETFIMRIIRGAGLRGLSSIWPVRQMDGRFIIRPLLGIEKGEIARFLKEKQITHRIDSSNLSDIPLRNKIRLKILPLLEKEYNPNIKRILVKEAEVLRESYSYIEREATRAFDKVILKKDAQIIIDLKNLNKKDSSIIKEILRQSIYYVKGDLNQITYKHLVNIQKLINESQGTSILHLPANIKIVKEYDKLKLYKDKVRIDKKPIKIPPKLKIPGVTSICDLGLKIKAEILSKKSYRPKKDKTVEFINLNELNGVITLRFKKPHDKFKPLGMNKEKSIKEFFINNKIPKNKRNKTLLAISGNKIIWVVGLRISEDVKVTPQTKKVLRLTLIKKL